MKRGAMTNPPIRRRPRRAAMTALAATLLALTGCSGGGAASGADSDGGAPPLAGVQIGGPFSLVDKAGHKVRWADFKGHWRIVYFGYTYCPDACPTDMAVEARALKLFAQANPRAAAAIRPLFITIDPARDTPAVVGRFAAAFSPQLIGLTGTPAEVDQAAKAFAVYYARGQNLGHGAYLMDHSRIAYLMGPDGQPIDMLPLEKGAQAVADDLARWVK